MAFLVDNVYYKINNSERCLNKGSIINATIYPNKELRDFEKENSTLIEEFKLKVREYLNKLMRDLEDKTKNIKPEDKKLKKEVFLKRYPAIKRLYNEFEEINEEGCYLISALSETIIDFDNLKFKNIWIDLGLKEEYCQKAFKNNHNISLYFEEDADKNITNLYKRFKKRFNKKVKDC